MPVQELPAEVIEHAFHHGCAISTPFCLSLCLVSSWARRIALPHLYSVVRLQTQASIMAFCRTIAKGTGSIPSAIPPRLHVRGLWIEPISNSVVDICNACENLEYISVYEQNLMWLSRPLLQPSATALPVATPSPISSNKNVHLWVVKGRPHRFLPLDSITPIVASPFLNTITHLVLDGSAGYNFLKNIRSFDRLTHLAVTYDGSPSQDLESLAAALRAAPQRDNISCVLIMLVDDVKLTTTKRLETLSWVAGVHVPRKIHVLPSLLGNFRAEWEEEMRTGVNVWERAEMNNRGEIFGAKWRRL